MVFTFETNDKEFAAKGLICFERTTRHSNTVKQVTDENAVFQKLHELEQRVTDFTNNRLKPMADAFYRDAYRLGDPDGLMNVVAMAYWDNPLSYSDKKPSDLFKELDEFIVKDDENARALFLRARAYQYGWGIGQNDQNASDDYDAAAKKGYSKAMLALGDAYRFSLLGFEKSKSNAFTQYDKAVGAGNIRGHIKKAQSLVYGAFAPPNDEDDKTTFGWVLKAVKTNPSNYAQNFMGWMCLNGRGVIQSRSKAKEIFDYLWENKKFTLAANNLGVMYRDGLGVERNISTAENYFRNAKDLGSGLAAEHLGYIHLLS